MKRSALVIALLAPLSAHADPYVSLFAVTEDSSCNSGCDLEVDYEPMAGIAAGYSTEGQIFYGAELSASNQDQAAALFAGYRVGDVALSFGGGAVRSKADLPAVPGFTRPDDAAREPFAFVEAAYSFAYARWMRFDADYEFTTRELLGPDALGRPQYGPQQSAGQASYTRDIFSVGIRVRF